MTMTDNELNEALAKWAGWTYHGMGWWSNPNPGGMDATIVPNYCGSLDAVATLEDRLDGCVIDERSLYYDYLLLVTPGWPVKGKYQDPFEMDWKIVRATARQRAEALAKTVGVWR